MLVRKIGLKISRLFFIIFYLNVVHLQTPSWAISTNPEWLADLRQKGLVMTEDDLKQLITDPTSNKGLRTKIAKRYSLIIEAISARKGELKSLYQKRDANEKQRIINDVQPLLSLIIVKVLTPLWMGGPWDLNGVPGETPNLSKPVACGHFIQKILTDAGFNIVKNRGTWLAYLSTSNLIRTLSDNKPKPYKSWNSTAAELKKQGPGMYVFGLDCGWGHVLFGKYDENGKLLFIHAGPHFEGLSVNYNDGEKYITRLCGKRIVFAKIDAVLAKKWLLGVPIQPCVVM